jgi:hypothetical protein
MPTGLRFMSSSESTFGGPAAMPWFMALPTEVSVPVEESARAVESAKGASARLTLAAMRVKRGRWTIVNLPVRVWFFVMAESPSR